MLLSHKLNFIWISIFISFHYLTKLPYVKHAIIFDNLFLVLGVEFHINNLTFCYKVLQTKNVNIITNTALKMSKYIFFWSKFSLICTLINQENLCIWTFLHSVTFDFYCIVPSYMSWVFYGKEITFFWITRCWRVCIGTCFFSIFIVLLEYKLIFKPLYIFLADTIFWWCHP